MLRAGLERTTSVSVRLSLASMQMWTARVRRDPVLILKSLRAEVRAFLKELEQKVDKLSRRYAMAA